MDSINKYIVVKFLKFVNDELSLNQPFKVKLVTQRDGDLKTYAYYDPNNGLIKVYCKNRGMADVLRSIAHELIHHHQNQSGKLDQPTQDIGGEIEDEANSVAGQLVKKFGYANPKLAIYTNTL
jgi:Zn-dependent peptidase ImmA (M78 family)